MPSPFLAVLHLALCCKWITVPHNDLADCLKDRRNKTYIWATLSNSSSTGLHTLYRGLNTSLCATYWSFGSTKHPCNWCELLLSDCIQHEYVASCDGWACICRRKHRPVLLKVGRQFSGTLWGDFLRGTSHAEQTGGHHKIRPGPALIILNNALTSFNQWK